MAANGFCVTLPCNASLDLYADNQISNYKTKLTKQLDLKGQWEVAMLEIQYPRTWKTFSKEDATFLVTDTKLKQTTRVTITRGFYNDINALISEINARMLPLTTTLGYDQIKHKVFIKTHQDIDIVFKGSLAVILGFKPDVKHSCAKDWTDVNRKHYAPHPADINAGFYALFVYSDIVEYQLVGDSFVPLLRRVHISGSNHDIITVSYNQPHYVTTTKALINDIAIEVKDDQNKHVNFSYGKVVVKLHFRPVKQEYSF